MIMNDVLHATSPQSTRPFYISVFDVLGVGMGFHVKDAQKERGPDDGTGVGQTGRQAGRQAGGGHGAHENPSASVLHPRGVFAHI